LVPQVEEDIVKVEWVNESNLSNYLSASYSNIQAVFDEL